MLDFSNYIDLPIVWGVIIAFSVFMYVLLDGFDLGLGILFPFAPTDECRDKMMNSIAPFWDGNETWLVLGGGGLLVAFPLAYSILIPAFYLPIILMLLGLIFRGVAFEFRFKASVSHRKFWDWAFHFGAVTATFCQGLILGTYVQGITVVNERFAGQPFDWLSPFSIAVGVALICGYVLLGATWLIMKTDGAVYLWAKRVTLYITLYVAAFMGVVSLWVPFLNDQIMHRWFSWPNIIYLAPIPLTSLVVIVKMVLAIAEDKQDYKPFLYVISLFALCYLGLAISLWPWVVPFAVTLREASSSGSTQSIVLLGLGFLLPIILSYTAYCYYIFRGKVTKSGYY